MKKFINEYKVVLAIIFVGIIISFTIYFSNKMVLNNGKRQKAFISELTTTTAMIKQNEPITTTTSKTKSTTTTAAKLNTTTSIPNIYNTTTLGSQEYYNMASPDQKIVIDNFLKEMATSVFTNGNSSPGILYFSLLTNMADKNTDWVCGDISRKYVSEYELALGAINDLYKRYQRYEKDIIYIGDIFNNMYKVLFDANIYCNKLGYGYFFNKTTGFSDIMNMHANR